MMPRIIRVTAIFFLIMALEIFKYEYFGSSTLSVEGVLILAYIIAWSIDKPQEKKNEST